MLIWLFETNKMQDISCYQRLSETLIRPNWLRLDLFSIFYFTIIKKYHTLNSVWFKLCLKKTEKKIDFLIEKLTIFYRNLNAVGIFPFLLWHEQFCCFDFRWNCGILMLGFVFLFGQFLQNSGPSGSNWFSELFKNTANIIFWENFLLHGQFLKKSHIDILGTFKIFWPKILPCFGTHSPRKICIILRLGALYNFLNLVG